MKLDRTVFTFLTVTCMLTLVALTGCPPPEPEVVEDVVDLDPPELEDIEIGVIDLIGSTTIQPIAEAWAVAYHEAHPGGEINVAGGGSSSGITALIHRATGIAMASREMSEEEIEQARENEVEPVGHVMAHDGIVPVVHPENPATSLTFAQLSDIFTGEVNSWSDIDVHGIPGDGMIVVVRDETSATHETWKQVVLGMDPGEERDYVPSEEQAASNLDVRRIVADNPSAIGYVGLGFVDDTVRAVPVVPGAGSDPVEATPETVRDNSYPISRDLYMYTDTEPESVIEAFLEWGRGSEGQALVAEQGFVPLD